MTDSTAPTTAPSDLDIVVIPARPWHVPARLRLPAQPDTNGRIWPSGGVRRVQELSLDALRAAGVEVSWQLPDGTEIDAASGTLLIAAREEEQRQGYTATFAPAAVPVGAPKQPVEGQ